MRFEAARLVANPPLIPVWAHGAINAPGGNGAGNSKCYNSCCNDWFEGGDDDGHLLLTEVSRDYERRR